MNPPKISLSPDSSSPASPRLVCRMVRPWSAVFDVRRSRHVTSCADCQAYFQSGDVLDAALRRDAVAIARESSSASEGLEREIMRAVRNARPSPGRHAARGPWMLGGISAAAAAAAVVAVSLNRTPVMVGHAETPNAIAATEAAVIVDAVETFSNRLVDSVIPSAGKLVAQNPLQEEMGSVYSDMRSALDFLALNFLPASTKAEPRSRTI
jgi:hypothetical protein